MGLLRLSGFTGGWPIRDSRALPDNAAAKAVNVHSFGGAYLRSYRSGTLRKTLEAGTATVFRIPIGSPSEGLDASFWMQFTDIDTDVVRAPIVNDQYERIYWASPSTGLKYAPKASIIAGATGLDVGVSPPTAVPVVAPVAGTGALDPVTGLNTAPKVTREYLVTYISEYGEESQPGPAYGVTGFTDQDWLVDPIPQPGSPGTRAAFQKIRLYRTITSITGVTGFYKVVDLDVGTTFYMDRLSDTTVSGNTLLGTDTWALPPAGMQGLVAMPNGIFVSWKDNNLFFSENYHPHAWPVEYMITVDFPIVGLGVFGSSCVVCTTGTPAVVSGIKANAISMTKIDTPLPCLSRHSIVSAPEGVYYASPDGLVTVGSAGIAVVTQDLFDRKGWLWNSPGAFRSALVNGQYLVSWGVHAPPEGDGLIFSPSEPSKFGVSYVNLGAAIDNVGVEPWSGRPYYIQGTGLYEWDVPDNSELAYSWLSKEFIYPQPTNFSAAQLYFDDDAGPVTLKVNALLRGEDGTLSWQEVFNAAISRSGQELRLPSGFRSDVWQVEFSGTAKLQAFLMATTVKELRGA